MAALQIGEYAAPVFLPPIRRSRKALEELDNEWELPEQYGKRWSASRRERLRDLKALILEEKGLSDMNFYQFCEELCPEEAATLREAFDIYKEERKAGNLVGMSFGSYSSLICPEEAKTIREAHQIYESEHTYRGRGHLRLVRDNSWGVTSGELEKTIKDDNKNESCLGMSVRALEKELDTSEALNYEIEDEVEPYEAVNEVYVAPDNAKTHFEVLYNPSKITKFEEDGEVYARVKYVVDEKRGDIIVNTMAKKMDVLVQGRGMNKIRKYVRRALATEEAYLNKPDLQM